MNTNTLSQAHGAIETHAGEVRATRLLAIFTGVLVLLGLAFGNSLEGVGTYMVLVVAAVLPSILWVRMGAPGIPVWPAISFAHIQYFAWPVLFGSENTLPYTPSEIMIAGLTVALYLLVATGVWRLLCSMANAVQSTASGHVRQTRAVTLLLVGIAAGILFHLANIFGLFGSIGAVYGVVRAVILTIVSVSCFLTGVARARGQLRGRAWGTALAGIGLLIILSWTSLFLVSGTLYALAALLGYVIISRRVPWLLVGVLFAVISVLHLGKAEMRMKYWEQNVNYGRQLSLAEMPAFALAWIEEGFSVISRGEAGEGVLGRASLLHILLLAQAMTPSAVDYLGGDTYALLPGTLVPRFIDADKPASQVAMDLLNVQYGLLTVEGTASTAVGWGLIAEAYANFGYAGVIGIAVLFGGFCGLLHLWSVGAETISIPSLTSIAALIVFINLEAESVSLFSTLYQSIAAVVIFFLLYRWFVLEPIETTASGATA